MAGSIFVTNQFAAQAGPIPLSQLDANFNQDAQALNSLSTFSNWFLDSGSTNVWTVTVGPPQIVSYTAGLNIQVKVSNTITGPCTLNVNGLGAKAVTNPDGTPMVTGNVVAGAIVDLFYDGTQFQVNGGTQGASGTVPSSRTILTTAPLTGGGDLTANRTLAVNTFGAAQAGVVPSSGGGTTTYLRADGTWAAPPGATSGTVTNIATTAPLTGGPITGTGTLGVSTFGSGNSGVVPSSGGGTSNFLRADGNWAVPPSTLGAVTPKVKAANTTRSAFTTLTIDPDLQYAISGSVGTYDIEAYIVNGSNASAGGLNIYLNYSGSAFSSSVYNAYGNMNATSIYNTVRAMGIQNAFATTANTDWLIMKGTLVINGPGTVSVFWAQNSSNATATVLGQGSFLKITQLA